MFTLHRAKPAEPEPRPGEHSKVWFSFNYRRWLNRSDDWIHMSSTPHTKKLRTLWLTDELSSLFNTSNAVWIPVCVCVWSIHALKLYLRRRTNYLLPERPSAQRAQRNEDIYRRLLVLQSQHMVVASPALPPLSTSWESGRSLGVYAYFSSVMSSRS